MRWMETIRVRLEETPRARVLAELSAQLAAADDAPGLEAAHLYADARIPTDLCIQFHWHRHGVPEEGSALGRQLAAGLAPAGRVHHSVWREEARR